MIIRSHRSPFISERVQTCKTGSQKWPTCTRRYHSNTQENLAKSLHLPRNSPRKRKYGIYPKSTDIRRFLAWPGAFQSIYDIDLSTFSSNVELLRQHATLVSWCLSLDLCWVFIYSYSEHLPLCRLKWLSRYMPVLTSKANYSRSGLQNVKANERRNS